MHDHAHDHGDGHSHSSGRTLRLERDVLEKNDRLAAANRRWLAARGIVAVNLLSAPGAGKTTLLERTIGALGSELAIHVIEGDQATTTDADRVLAAGARAVQINTGAGCHLDSAMVAGALPALDPPPGSLVVIENVGNLVCPALFDLGEHAKVVVAAVTEGEDKPLKYPHVFRASEVVLLNKIDLLPYVAFDRDRWRRHARTVNPRVLDLAVSATRGDGLEAWYEWLRVRAAEHAGPGPA
jgi:hydrogenase nickel incorporation protein HypB